MVAKIDQTGIIQVVVYLYAVAVEFVLIVADDGGDVRSIAVAVVKHQVVIAVEHPALGLARLVAHVEVVVALIEVAEFHTMYGVYITCRDALFADIEEYRTGDVLKHMLAILAPRVADERRC